MFRTLQDGVPKELRLQEQWVVANDNTVSWNGRHLQIPESPLRQDFVVEGTFGVVWGDPGLRSLVRRLTVRSPNTYEAA
jgi:hypothetical protein